MSLDVAYEAIRKSWALARLDYLSDCHGGQNDTWIVADLGQGFQCHVIALYRPLAVLFEQEGSDHIGATLDFSFTAFNQIRAVDIAPMFPGKPAVEPAIRRRTAKGRERAFAG